MSSGELPKPSEALPLRIKINCLSTASKLECSELYNLSFFLDQLFQHPTQFVYNSLQQIIFLLSSNLVQYTHPSPTHVTE